MKFLVDAQLPRHLAASLKWSGHDVLHTLDLPSGNRTPDWRINEISVEEQRIVVTKDAASLTRFCFRECLISYYWCRREMLVTGSLKAYSQKIYSRLLGHWKFMSLWKLPVHR
jgi:predicted nuclease of predicted toxin-antitoxin system